MTVHFRPTGYTYAPTSRNDKPAHTATVKFSGYHASCTPENGQRYISHIQAFPKLNELAPQTTSLNRDYPVNEFIAGLLSNTPKTTAIHDGGCSDGSSTDGIRISIAAEPALKPKLRDPNQIKVFAYDQDPAIIKVAQSEYRVHCRQEQINQEEKETPAAGEHWNSYFENKGSSGPSNFRNWVKDFPKLLELLRDRVINATIQNGRLWWDRVKSEQLPITEFTQDSIGNYVDKKPSNHKRQIYIFANSLVYSVTKNPHNTVNLEITQDEDMDTEKLNKFMNVFNKIQEHNHDPKPSKRKEVIIILGDLEVQALMQNEALRLGFANIGMTGMRADEIQQLTNLPEANAKKLEGKIWRLNTDFIKPVIFTSED